MLLLLSRMAGDTVQWLTCCAIAQFAIVVVLAIVERAISSPKTNPPQTDDEDSAESLASRAAAWKDLQVKFCTTPNYLFLTVSCCVQTRNFLQHPMSSWRIYVTLQFLVLTMYFFSHIGICIFHFSLCIVSGSFCLALFFVERACTTYHLDTTRTPILAQRVSRVTNLGFKLDTNRTSYFALNLTYCFCHQFCSWVLSFTCVDR